MLVPTLAMWLCLLATPSLPTPDSVGEEVRVSVLSLIEPRRIEVVAPSCGLRTSAGRVVPAGTVLVVERHGRIVRARTSDGWQWTGDRLAVGSPECRADLDLYGRETLSRSFVGVLDIRAWDRRLVVVARMSLESLVASAVAAELEQVEEPAALEACAVTLRSYLVANRTRHASEGFDFCDTTHCLLSRGLDAGEDGSRAAARAATAATAGVVLTRGERVLVGYCTGTCGGATTTPGVVWGRKESDGYAGVACAMCTQSRFFRWERTAERGEIQQIAERLVRIPVRQDVDLRTVTADGGWVEWVIVRSGGREERVRGDTFRMAVGRRLGWNVILSPRFSIERVPGRFRFRGGGHGHGIGLCLAGAIERARRGETRDEILAAYFPLARAKLLQR